MAATLHNIPLFVLEHKWSSDIESNGCSDLDIHDGINVFHQRKLKNKIKIHKSNILIGICRLMIFVVRGNYLKQLLGIKKYTFRH